MITWSVEKEGEEEGGDSHDHECTECRVNYFGRKGRKKQQTPPKDKKRKKEKKKKRRKTKIQE